MTKNTRNVFSLVLAPANRTLLIGLVALTAIVFGVIAYIATQSDRDSPQGSASVNTSKVSVGLAPVATGKESKEYLKEIRKFNDVVLQERRKENPSAHPLPINDGLSGESCKVNHDAWSNCLRATGVLGEGDCATTDTQCMIDNGLIAEGECAPSDLACQKKNERNSDGYCGASNYSCIASRARKANCEVSDTQCLRNAGIIGPEACAPGDKVCDGTRFSFCDINNLDCIEKRAKAVGCSLSDTECLRENGIIAETACAPNDAVCKQDTKNLFCSPADLSCIVSKARKSGCEVDDSICLRAAGIISATTCSPADDSCDGEEDGYCPSGDLNCITAAALKVSCDLSDTQCLRDKGVISPFACAPHDSDCKSTRTFCDPLDSVCIAKRSVVAGCDVKDTRCLISAGIIPPGSCASGDLSCGRPVTSSAMCDPKDSACISSAAATAGCSLSDTLCLRENNIIGHADCAPADTACRSELVAKEGGLRGGSSRDSKYYRAAASSASNSANATTSKLNDKQYMDQLLAFVKDKVPSRGHLETGFTNKPNDGGYSDSGEKPRLKSERTDLPVSSTPSEANRGEVLFTAGEVLYGITDIALSSDFEGPVSVTLLEPGTLHRAKLLGSMVRVGDKVRLELSRLVHRDGHTTPINAVALDPKTTYAAVASRVDHHYLYRFGWWGFGTVLSAIGKATALGAQETIIVPDGGVAQSSTLDSSGEAKVALGELGEDIGETMKANLERDITVHVDANAELGIFFLDTVYDEADTK